MPDFIDYTDPRVALSAHDAKVAELFNTEVFDESLEGGAAAHAAASLLLDWESTDDGTLSLTDKYTDVNAVLDLLAKWKLTLDKESK